MALTDYLKLRGARKGYTPWRPAASPDEKLKQQELFFERDSPAGAEPGIEEYKPSPAGDTSLIGVIPQRGLSGAPGLSAAEAARRKAIADREEFLAGLGKAREAAPDTTNAAEFLASKPAAEKPAGGGLAGWWKEKGRGALSRGLTAAAYSINANVGRGQAGQQWKQGILRGITGLGMAEAARAAQEARAGEREQSLTDRMMLEKYKKGLEPSSEQKFSEFQRQEDYRQTGREKVAKIGTEEAIKKAAAIKAAEAGMSSKDKANLRRQADEAATAATKAYQIKPADAAVFAQELYDNWMITAGEKGPVNPFDVKKSTGTK